MQVVVCDACRTDAKPARTYRLVQGGRSGEIDLCAEDAEHLERLLEMSRSISARRKPFGHSVKTTEEIEAEKAARAAP